MEKITIFLSTFLLIKMVIGFISVDPTSRMILDNNGRSILFHGVNMVTKEFPYHPNLEEWSPEMSLVQEDIDNLKKWGFNGVRLGVMWPGVEPEEGVYNATYLATMRKIVDLLGANGIYSIVDMHQDVLSPKFCGEGVPDYIVDPGVVPFPEPYLPYPFPVDEHGYPNLTQCLEHNFLYYYFSDGACRTFEKIFLNYDNARDAFFNFWNQVVETFKDSEYVIGYELINEPFFGDIYTHPSLLVSGNAEKERLMPMYKMLYEQIRVKDPSHIVLFDDILGQLINGGFDSGPGGFEDNDKQLYSYHIYCITKKESGEPSNLLFCNITDQIFWDLAQYERDRMKIGGILTEFGADDQDVSSLEALNYVEMNADKQLQSYFYWQFKFFDDITTTASVSESFYFPNGTLKTGKVKTLSRTYAQAIQGIPMMMNFDPITSKFQFKFQFNSSIPLQTEIYLNEEYYYPNGFSVNISPNGVQWTHPEENKIEIIVPEVIQPDLNGHNITFSIIAN
ncbi:cellulase [Anaeramoeba ignava]|uniref:Cellulase n=1 Tax=Anaeramoeba ignava TaxID=1746090 RepID=A0A9Q0R6B5_ANAIG|nr:cellulase [Anaeramoeba ignava]